MSSNSVIKFSGLFSLNLLFILATARETSSFRLYSSMRSSILLRPSNLFSSSLNTKNLEKVA